MGVWEYGGVEVRFRVNRLEIKSTDKSFML